ncbi:hypothetical protein LTR66_011715 [Elasticomyces elasticus]|nr:hypothetical protein LTR66_011715 [Elasticomyces elasticus]
MKCRMRVIRPPSGSRSVPRLLRVTHRPSEEIDTRAAKPCDATPTSRKRKGALVDEDAMPGPKKRGRKPKTTVKAEDIEDVKTEETVKEAGVEAMKEEVAIRRVDMDYMVATIAIAIASFTE